MMTGLQLFTAVVVLAAVGAHAVVGIEKEVATCSQDVHGSCAPSGSASLLQKVFQRDEKTTLTQEQPPHSDDNLYDTVCTGTQAQGRCWFLSEMGESCEATCKLHGRRFSFAIADPNMPMIPTLVGHEPKVKQQAWAALECYSPSEDRYHTANENAARHYVSDVGNWSHEHCKLACPCGGAESDRCSWRAPPTCAAEFMWKGVKYSGCATVDLEHERPWCQHNFQHTEKDNENYAADWSYCTYSCIPEQPPAPKEGNCGWKAADSCVKEYDYESTHFVGCTGTDHDTPWCSNEDPYKGSWSLCSYTCKEEEKKEPNCETTPCTKELCWDGKGRRPIGNDCCACPEEPSEDKLCTWQPKFECAKTFEYKGVEYSGCTKQDHPSPWCSLDRIHKGAWESCDRVCTSASGSVVPVPQKPAPVPKPAYPVPDPQQSYPVPDPQEASGPAFYPVPDPQEASGPAFPVPTTPTNFDDACARHPDSENDDIGNSVPLDEAGYKIASAADSPLNMKRFVCRVVGAAGCRVVDLSALMAFVPYYSGHVSHQTYKHLEAELTTLCHAGGKWVVPRPLP